VVCPSAFGTGTDPFRTKTANDTPEVAENTLLLLSARDHTVCENEDSSSYIDSAVFDLNSGYGKRTIDMQNNARKEIRMRPLTASSDVHLAGLQSIPCFRSLNNVSISSLSL